jgi:lipoyl(octanoyl) transferase
MLGDSRHIETVRFMRRMPYREAYEVMRSRQREVEAGTQGHALFLLEHEPVITLGRNHQARNLLCTEEQLTAMGIAIERVDRGGDATYHGPGQLTAYPVLNLKAWKRSIRWYLRSLEEVVIRLLEGYGLAGGRIEGFTGVWVGDRKVAAIGIGIHNWTTYHGVAVNVDPDLRRFGCIIPCGIEDKRVASLKELLGHSLDMQDVFDHFEKHFRAYFEGCRGD